MSLLYQQSPIYQSYEREIWYLRRNGSRLLDEIKRQEIRMNQRKQQKLKPHQKQFSKLKRMIDKMLRLMGLIDTYRYFQILNVPLSYQNQAYFQDVVNQNYEHLLQRFLTSFHLHLRKKCREHQKKEEKEENELVDFTIN